MSTQDPAGGNGPLIDALWAWKINRKTRSSRRSAVTECNVIDREDVSGRSSRNSDGSRIVRIHVNPASLLSNQSRLTVHVNGIRVGGPEGVDQVWEQNQLRDGRSGRLTVEKKKGRMDSTRPENVAVAATGKMDKFGTVRVSSRFFHEFVVSLAWVWQAAAVATIRIEVIPRRCSRTGRLTAR